jgi:diguanylate cyclase (GGDEF)-like protein
VERDRYKKEIPDKKSEDSMSLVKSFPDLILRADADGSILDVLSYGLGLGGWATPERAKKYPILQEFFPQSVSKRVFMAHISALRYGKVQKFSFSTMAGNRERSFEVRIVPVAQNGSSYRSTLVTIRDLNAEEDGGASEIVKKIFEMTTEGMVLFDRKRGKARYNDLFAEFFGLEQGEGLERGLEDLERFLKPSHFEKIRRMVEQSGEYFGEADIREEDHSYRTLSLHFTSVEEEGALRYIIGVARSSDRDDQRAEGNFHFNGTRDSLTSLPNRRKLLSDLEKVLKRSESKNRHGALFFIDLDDFKFVNDTMGHAAGDKVLIECASRIRSVIRKRDIFGRLGGDEFLLITEELSSPKDLSLLAQKILAVLNQPISIGNYKHNIGASIGVAIFPDDSDDKEKLLQYADMAMYQAKKQGRNRYQFYSGVLNKTLKRRFVIEKALHQALEDEKLYIVFQLKMDLRSNVLTGFEVLMRVDESIVGQLSTAEVIPFAEESDLILQLGRKVFTLLCQTLFVWKRHLQIGHLGFSINLSRRQLMDGGLIDFIRETLQKYRIEPNMIEFEITESALVGRQRRAVETIGRLKALGCKVSIDNFGTGYSSLMALKSFPVDRLKMDRHFLRDITSSRVDRSIIKSAVNIADSIGIRTVAVGVESEEQKKIVQLMGFGEAQGNLYGTPVTAGETYKLLQLVCKRRDRI